MAKLKKHQVLYTEKTEAHLLDYVQFVSICAELIKVEYQVSMCDMRFKNPTLNNHAKRIIESAEQITRGLALISVNTDREDFMYNTSLQIHRLMKHFFQFPIEKLEALADALESGVISENNEQIT